MTNTVGNKNLGFLGTAYHFKLIYNLIWFPKFSKHILPYLSSTYFEQHEYKLIFNLIKNYFDKYSTVPNKQIVEQLIELHIESEIERDMLTEILRRLNKFSKALLAGEVENDSQYVQDTVEDFALQERLKHASAFLQTSIQTGNLSSAKESIDLIRNAFQIQEKAHKTIRMGTFNERLIEPQYVDAIPTGIPEIDELTGGLPKGKIGMFVAGQGVGKSSMLTLLANNAYLAGKKVLHIVMDENEPKEIERLHTARWCGIPTKHFTKYQDFVNRKYQEIHQQYKTGELVIDQLPSDTTTVADVKNFILAKQQEYGFEFDMVALDYVDELNSRKALNQWDTETEVMKHLKSMVVEMNIAFWTACQGKKEANDNPWLLFNHIGGSVAKIKKSQLIFSAGRPIDQRANGTVNIALLKCNYGKSGQQWENCTFKNSILELRFSQTISYLPEEVLRQGYDDDDERELMALLTEEERERLPEIEAAIKRDMEETGIQFVAPAPKPIVRREAYVPPVPTKEAQQVDSLKSLVSGFDFEGI